MADDVLIRVEGLSKKFCRDLKTSLRYGVADLTGDVLGRSRTTELRPKEFWAVENVDLQVRRGEILGLLGHNGAGKTTLLRILNGLIKPDAGRVELRGRVGALIALGAGFNPILTGRENIYINAAVLGMNKRKVDERIDEIIDFSGIGEFIDTPVRNYSSGMTVRLGFSSAAMLIKPDVLFLDEVLAVGDVSFTIKCLNAVRSIAANAAVVFVSHSMPLVSTFCTRAIVMDHGRTVLNTEEIGVAINHYYGLAKNKAQIAGAGGASVLDLRLVSDGITIPNDSPTIQQGEQLTARLKIRVDKEQLGEVQVVLSDATLAPVMSIPVLNEAGEMIILEPGEYELHVPLGPTELNAGIFSMLVVVRHPHTKVNLLRHSGLHPFHVHAERVLWAKVVRSGISKVLRTDTISQ